MCERKIDITRPNVTTHANTQITRHPTAIQPSIQRTRHNKCCDTISVAAAAISRNISTPDHQTINISNQNILSNYISKLVCVCVCLCVGSIKLDLFGSINDTLLCVCDVFVWRTLHSAVVWPTGENGQQKGRLGIRRNENASTIW